MRIEASVTSISWIPSEAVEGLPRLPFTFGVAHYDDPPPDRVDHLETMHRADLFREANELRGWIEVDDGKIVDYGHAGRGRIGLTRLRLGPKELAVPAVAMPTLQDTEVGDGWVRFTQTAGGRTGVPAPRSVRGKPYVQLNSAIAWTTLAVTIHANEKIEHELVGASTFPRHWIYDGSGALVQKSGVIAANSAAASFSLTSGNTVFTSLIALSGLSSAKLHPLRLAAMNFFTTSGLLLR